MALPWAAAVAVWAVLLAQIDGGSGTALSCLLAAWFGALIATPNYLLWRPWPLPPASC